MLYVTPNSQDAAFHFSVETYFLEHFPLDQPLFMIWQADQCAMLGANQVAAAEIDCSYAKKEQIQIVRRQSGGGTIYTDLGTLLYTLILPQTAGDVQEILRETVAGPIVRALNKLGIPAQLEGRNDILVAGKKVSGLAQYTRNGRVCTHGSLLYDADLDMLAGVLQVDDEKIRSKAIRSVRSRVTNLREHMATPVSTAEFWTLLSEALAQEWEMQTYTLTDTDLTKIDDICREKYANPAWTFGRDPQFSISSSKRFPAGKVEAFLDVIRGEITACSICGDFLATAPICGLEQMFTGKSFCRGAIADVLAGVDLRPYLGEITQEQLLSCIFE